MRGLVYPERSSFTSNNPAEFLIDVWFDATVDALFMRWYDSERKRIRFQKVDNPEVPIWIAKQPQKMNLEHIDANICNRELIPYLTKTEEIGLRLFDYSVQRFTNKEGQLVQRVYIKDLPKKGEYLHPDIYGSNMTIEELTMMDWVLKSYQKQGEHIFEKIPVPHDISYASFDIETIEDDDGIWRIHTNTFIDESSGDAYLDYWHREDFHRVEFLSEQTSEFIELVRKTLNEAIENSTLKGDTREAVLPICREIANKLNFKIRRFDTEEDLITETTKTMFTTYKPTLLMAYNTTYDLGMFQERVDRLGLPAGTMNERGIGFDDIKPSFANKFLNEYGVAINNLDENHQFYGDTIDPRKRCVHLHNMSHTTIVDLQTCYWSFRQYENPPSFSLNYLAERILGFGKFDYSHICNHITKLARTDYVWHSVYALLDSIILLMINRVTNDFLSRLGFTVRTKTNIEGTSQSSSYIPACFNADAIVDGNIPGSNINKILRSMSIKNAEAITKILNLKVPAYIGLARDLKKDQDFGGGCDYKLKHTGDH